MKKSLLVIDVHCVKFTVLDALKLGYKVNLITAGCKGVNLSPNDSENAFKEMKRLGAIINIALP